MQRIFILLPMVALTILIMFLYGCSHSTEPEKTVEPDSTGGPVVRKPNIYIYPTETCSVTIKLEFPLGGKIIDSEPVYNDGWSVKVKTSGKIDDEYDYLYYEAKCPEVYQYDAGWIVTKDSLNEFFSGNLRHAGFNEKENADFREYWIPKLVDHKYYIIYPQYSRDIQKIIRLKSSIKPDNILRLFYVIKGINSRKEGLPAPVRIPSFNRNG
ncbi:MAG: hypothetical protein P8184_16970, partial [Calditrichia bacterium]